MKTLRLAVLPVWMKVCGIIAPSPLAPALSMKVAIESVQEPIMGTFQPSLAMPLAICASSGPIA